MFLIKWESAMSVICGVNTSLQITFHIPPTQRSSDNIITVRVSISMMLFFLLLFIDWWRITDAAEEMIHKSFHSSLGSNSGGSSRFGENSTCKAELSYKSTQYCIKTCVGQLEKSEKQQQSMKWNKSIIYRWQNYDKQQHNEDWNSISAEEENRLSVLQDSDDGGDAAEKTAARQRKEQQSPLR